MKPPQPKVLVIDDDVPFANALVRWLSELGYQSGVANWGARGLILLEQGGFDAVLLDLNLPDVSGRDVIRQLRRVGVTVPVIVISGTSDMNEVVDMWHENAADFLRKPFRIEELAAALDRALERAARPAAAAKNPSGTTGRPASGEAASQPWELLDSAPDAMLVVDAFGRIQFINSQTERMFGYSRWVLTGMLLETLLPMRARSSHGEHLARYFAGPNVRPMGASLQLVGLRENGEEFPVEIALSSVAYAGTTMAIAAVRDITTKVQTERELRQGREDLAITLESIGDGVIVTDVEGRIVRMNPVAERLTGWPSQEAVGRDAADVFRIFHSQTREPMQRSPGAGLAGETAPGLASHTLLIARDGSERPISDNCAAIRASGGELRGAVFVFRDTSAEVAEQSSLRETARMQGQLDCAPITVVRLDRDARITHVNEAWRKFARDNGADAATIEGLGLDYIAATRGAGDQPSTQLADALCEVLAGRQDSFAWVYSCHAPKVLRWFKLDAQRVAADDAVVLIHADITGQHMAEARLRVQSVVAQALADRSPLLETCQRIMRTTCEELEWDFAATWVPSDGERVHCVDSWIKPGRDSVRMEEATRGATFERGRGLPGRVWAACSPEWIQDLALDPNFPRAPFATAAGLRTGFAVPLGAEGEVFAVVEFFSAVERAPEPELLDLFSTAGAQVGEHMLRSRAEQRAAEAERARRDIFTMLDAIFECAPVGIVAVDAGGKVQFINRVLPDRRREDIIGSDWLERVPKEKHEAQRVRLQSVLETGIHQTYETRVVASDGTLKWFSTQMGPMREGERIVGVILVSHEVTEVKRAQTEFASAQRMAAIGTLAAGVAHEINTPVQFLSDSVHFLRSAAADVFGLVEKLREVLRLTQEGAPVAELEEAVATAVEGEEEADLPYLQENIPKAFDRCLDGIERVSTIVRSLKEFAHPAQQEMAPVDLNRAIQNTLTIAASEYKYVAELATELSDLPPVVCHVNEINQVVLNLIVNAAHAIADVVKGSGLKGTIRVTTRQEGDNALLAIGDTGPGIPEAVGQRIFEPFFTTKEVGKGTGQGLALAWTVVKEKHGGELSFESKIGEGTTFFIRLPIAGRPPSQAAGGDR